MNVLVTGGAGFIGSALIRYLLTVTDVRVINVDRMSYAVHPYALASVLNHPNYQGVALDIRDRQGLTTVFERYQPEVVLHLAAETHVDRSIADADAFVQHNIVGTQVLLEVMQHYAQNLPSARRHALRLLYVSTDEVYGDAGEGAVAAGVFDELSPLRPSSPYSASKASAEHLVMAWHRTHGLPVLISRCSNNFGPFQHHEKLIPHMVRQALQHQPLPLYGSGRQQRHWLFVEDHVKALWLLAQHGQLGEVYNIGGDTALTNLEMVQRICALLDAERPSKRLSSYAELITHVADRLGHDFCYRMRSDKIRQALGWQPEIAFDEALAQTVRWCIRDWEVSQQHER